MFLYCKFIYFGECTISGRGESHTLLALFHTQVTLRILFLTLGPSIKQMTNFEGGFQEQAITIVGGGGTIQ